MKLLRRAIERDGQGEVTVIPEVSEDLWHLFHIITAGDHIRATTIRKIQKETNTGSVSTDRVKLVLEILVEQVDFDPQGGTLRISGKNVGENKFVKLGQYHTIELELNRKVTIVKPVWDTIFLERLKDATDIARTADVAAVVCTEGLAHVCLISQHMTVERQKIEVTVPKKRQESAHDKALEKFFDMILQAILKHVDFKIVKCVILASPGFVKDQLLEYMLKTAQTKDLKEILSNKDKFVPIHSSSGHKGALKEVLADPNIARKLEDTKAAGEVKTLNQFYETLKTNPNRAFYGPRHVEVANENMAVQTLLVTDELFRSADIKTRKRYVDLVESVKANGGQVVVFSSMHPSGEQLQKLSGVAAILRFPLEVEIESEEEEDSDSESDEEEDPAGNSATTTKK